MASKQLTEMNLEELEHAQQTINQERQHLKAQAVAIQHELDRRAVRARAQDALANMSDAEKAVLHQVLNTEGIPSAQVVGTPGK